MEELSFDKIKFLVRPLEHPEKEYSSIISISPLMLLVPLNYVPDSDKHKVEPTDVMAEALVAFMNELEKDFEFHTLNYD